MMRWLAIDLSPAIRFARGFGLAVACALAASACAFGGWFLVTVLGAIALDQPGLFMLAVFAISLWAFVRRVFLQRVEN